MGFMDITVAVGLKQIINEKIKNFGSVKDLQLDSGKKTLYLLLQLEGETDPLQVTVTNYELVKTGDFTVVLIKEVTTSKHWVNVLWTERIKQIEYEIPPQFAPMIRFLI